MSESFKEMSLSLVNRIAPGWILRQPLSVRVQLDDDGGYLLSDETFYVYGEGATLSEAQHDYIRSLIEYFTIVSEYDDEPSCQLLAHLKQYLHQA